MVRLDSMFDFIRRCARRAQQTVRRDTIALPQPMESSSHPQIAYNPQLVPPLHLMRMEGIEVLEEWFRWGEEWSVLLRAFGGVRATSDVLEIGCGLGRIAFPLRYVIRNGTYRGFDISPQKIDFLKRNFAAAYPNFQFEYADVNNTEYNPTGELAATDFRFPYADAQFDVVYAASVFTHMLPDACAHYFAEASRVLKGGGQCLFSFFALDFYTPGHPRPLGFGNSRFDFAHSWADYGNEFALVAPENPELMTAYASSLITKMARLAGLALARDPIPGLWSGTQDQVVGAQDLFVLRKI
jgi:SAM-dependent methyltransferase